MFRYLPGTSLPSSILSLFLGIQFTPHASAEQPVEDQATLTEQADSFDDIATHWSRHIINWLAGNNPAQTSYLDSSEQRFRPGCPITRGEWIALSVNILDLPNRPDAASNPVANAPICPDSPAWKCPFSDVPATLTSDPSTPNPHYQTTLQAFRTGMISGYPDGTFRPQQTINYAEAVASLAAGLNLVPQIDSLKQRSGEEPSIIGTDYFINGRVMENAWFAPALHGSLLANLVALDWPLEFYPYRPPLSRGEAAVMMYLTLAYQGQASLDDPILRAEVVPHSGEYALRHIRMAGDPSFSFGPPAVHRQCTEEL
ncbi:s-layer protein [Leptolyngbya sp. Heron Island J]|uniref:S-layer homology domain-containing protein n=1 Tax=Leptolyngbya sp. Heron Island J TaxID=1385935 RepID=UPI0003B98993|nr:S-layer homology domain-containing protein [Leptolyngbya sp. Heron Island J]ESA35967.1 s-layer protein [Leptolyngbya sp. Heron Island J]